MMQRKKLLIITVCVLSALALALTVCLLTRSRIGVIIDEGRLSDEEFFGRPELIVKATVGEETDVYFTHPLGKAEKNAHVTVYGLKTSEVYKGEAGETLQLKVYNGKGMSPMLYYLGWDLRYILDEKEEPFRLEPGREYILGLIYAETEYEQEGGYVLCWGETWCFAENEEGLYENPDPGQNHRQMDLELMKGFIYAYE